ncbi:polymeric immunoglobulin receptor-like [Colossoma macropomum]|uniref:polymeric immunoglobulin receptor-like n=1 Tax=Colossoma macropomum TaxID=42526 RepID=UPI0018650322|nr:polymeric immunoglobulin receptor-like [Colossoma macropomum]
MKIFFTLLMSGLISYLTFGPMSLQDSGLYQCGETGVWNYTVNLKVNEDQCCLGPNTVTAFLGETVTINCSYPEQFKRKTKLFYKKIHNQYFTAVTQSQRDRFSISDNRRSKVLSVSISDVGEDDGGVYFCGAGTGGGLISYNSFFTEIQLRITGQETSTLPIEIAPSSAAYTTTSTAPTAITSDEEHFSMNKFADDYENYPHGNQNNIRMYPIYQSLDPNTGQSDSVYQTLNPNIHRSDSVYQSLNPNTNQPDTVYQSLV